MTNQPFVMPPDSFSLIDHLAKLFPPRLPTTADLATEAARLAYAEELGKQSVVEYLKKLRDRSQAAG
jgi:hypothetical protein